MPHIRRTVQSLSFRDSLILLYIHQQGKRAPISPSLHQPTRGFRFLPSGHTDEYQVVSYWVWAFSFVLFFWLCWVLAALWGSLYLARVGATLVAALRLLILVASLIAEHGL